MEGVRRMKLRMTNATSFWQKSKMAAVLAFVLLFAIITYNVGFAKEEQPLQKIHHVYVNDEYVASVSQPQMVNDLIAQKEQQALAQYENYNIDMQQPVDIVTEKVSEATINDERAMTAIDEALVVEAEALAIEVNGQVVTYVQNKEAYDAVIRQIYLQHVTEQQLTQFEQLTGVAPKPAHNESLLTNIRLNEQVSIYNTKVEPADIKAVDNAVRALTEATLQTVSYTVNTGDSIQTIAAAHNVTPTQLVEQNAGLTEDSVLTVGQQLAIEQLKPQLSVYTVFSEQVDVVVPFETIVKNDDAVLKGVTKHAQKGVNGTIDRTYEVRKVNGEVIGKSITAEQTSRTAQHDITLNGTKDTIGYGTANFLWPAVDGIITSKVGARWGRQHQGIDIARPLHDNILSADGGVVVIAQNHSTYGNYIKIDHQNGYETIYAHLSAFKVNVGDKVGRGQIIGTMGSTGRSTGKHLHFEVYKNGNIQNPLNYVTM